MLTIDLKFLIISYLHYNKINKLCNITNICNNKLLWLKLLDLDYSNDDIDTLKAKYLASQIDFINITINKINMNIDQQINLLKRQIEILEEQRSEQINNINLHKYEIYLDLAKMNVTSQDLLYYDEEELNRIIIIYQNHDFNSDSLHAISQTLSESGYSKPVLLNGNRIIARAASSIDAYRLRITKILIDNSGYPDVKVDNFYNYLLTK